MSCLSDGVHLRCLQLGETLAWLDLELSQNGTLAVQGWHLPE